MTKRNRDTIVLNTPPGFKALIESHAYSQGLSVNRWILEAVIDKCPQDLRKELPAIRTTLGRPKKKACPYPSHADDCDCRGKGGDR